MEELSLKWDEHHPAVISVFEELLAKGTLVDCTIAADGQYVKAHKVVLAACSPYFELLFSQEAEKNPIVVLKDMKFQELKHLIDFVYRGQVKLPKAQLDAFVSAAETLQIKGLSGQQTKKISERFANNANKTVSSREGCSSPVPRKRRRSSYTETNEDSQSEPGNESSSDSNMRENFIPTPIPLGVPSTSTASSSTGMSSHSASSQQSRSLTETRFPSHDQPSASPEQVLPDVQTVVKTEPEEPTEPLAQVFFPEPKNEEYVDDLAMLESGAGSSDMQGGTSQENTNNYPALQVFLQHRSSKELKMSKRKSFSLEEKFQVCCRLERGESNSTLAQELNVSRSTISTIWKNRHSVRELVERGDSLKCRKHRRSTHDEIDQELIKWFKIQRMHNFPLSGPILHEKANEFLKSSCDSLPGQSSSEPQIISRGWIQRFCSRHNIFFKRHSGEGGYEPFE